MEMETKRRKTSTAFFQSRSLLLPLSPPLVLPLSLSEEENHRVPSVTRSPVSRALCTALGSLLGL
jgi:hypothetical protein